MTDDEPARPPTGPDTASPADTDAPADTDDTDAGGPGRLAERLDELFTAGPDLGAGEPYTLITVSRGVAERGAKAGLSHLSGLRRGVTRNSRMSVVLALADFFGVSPASFFEVRAGQAATVPDPPPELNTFVERLDHLFRTVVNPATGAAWSVEEMAAAMNRRGIPVRARYLTRLRSGEARDPTTITVQALADVFGVVPSFLVVGTVADQILPPAPIPSQAQPGSFSARLDYLFRTILDPRTGREYDPATVSKRIHTSGGTTSASYLWKLRRGQARNPTTAIQGLADFFGVSPLYFFDTSSANRYEADLDTLAALRSTGVHDLVLRTARLRPEQVQAVRDLITTLEQQNRTTRADRRTTRSGQRPNDSDIG